MSAELEEERPMATLVEQAKRRMEERQRAAVDARPEERFDPEAERAAADRDRRGALWEREVPRRFRSASLFHSDVMQSGAIAEWAAPALPANLLLLGPVGSGKTFLGFAAIRHVLHRLADFEFHPVERLFDELRPGGPEGALDRLSSLPLLFVDDVGMERASDWTRDRLDTVINRRWMEELPTIATSNLSPEELETTIGLRAYSRLARSGATVVWVSGDDRRKS